jgi:hypothetical protein
MLPVLFHVCKTWFPTLGEEHVLRMIEYRVLGPKRKEEVKGWRNLLVDEFS